MYINDSCAYSIPQNESLANPEPATQDSPLTPRHAGAPLGNQNARIHGFYAHDVAKMRGDAIDEAEQIEGLVREIALLRHKLQKLEETDPDNIMFFFKAVNTLSNVVARRRFIPAKKDGSAILAAVKQVFRDVIIPPEMIKDLLEK